MGLKCIKIEFMNKKCQELLTNGNNHLDNNDLQTALYYFDKVAKWHPKCEVINQVHKVRMFILERLNNLQKAKALSDKYKNINDTGLQRVRAIIMKRVGETDNALNLALNLLQRSDLDDKSNQELHFLIADIYNSKGEIDKAYHYYQEGNKIVKNLPYNQQFDKNIPLGFIDLMHKNFLRINNDLFPPTHNTNTKDPIFLVGFPRSGTTLLRVILNSHSNISCIDEQPTFPVSHKLILEDGENAINYFANLSTNEKNKLRNTYWKNTYNYTDTSDDLIIDKYPLRFIDVGVIHKIFPNAKYIFALRHPLDCILSCFMQNFEINDSMANFYNLSDGVHFYRKSMKLWKEYMNNLNLDVHFIYYENLVRNFEEEVGKLTDFLNMELDENMLNYYENPQLASTPSYNQVIKKPYTSSLYRYKNYEKYLNEFTDEIKYLTDWLNYEI